MARIIILMIALFITLADPVCAAESEPWPPYIVEASGRFDIPENWIRAVIAIESGGDPKAVSPKGAMGLMQLMPDTWDGMRATYDLGSDPFDPHANILAGTAYLRVMFDRFGYPALFAAYNAGPARYEDFLRAGKPLPDETKAYAAAIEQALSGTPILTSIDTHTPRHVASGTGLFFQLSSTGSGVSNVENSSPSRDLFIRLSSAKAGE